MSDQIYQLTPLTCNMCGQTGVTPREEQHYDRFTQEIVTEAVWQCFRCGSKFNAGVVSRVKQDEKEQG